MQERWQRGQRRSSRSLSRLEIAQTRKSSECVASETVADEETLASKDRSAPLIFRIFVQSVVLTRNGTVRRLLFIVISRNS